MYVHLHRGVGGGGKQGNKQTKWNLSHLFLSPFSCAKYVHVSVREFDKDRIRVLVRCREAFCFSPFFLLLLSHLTFEPVSSFCFTLLLH